MASGEVITEIIESRKIRKLSYINEEVNYMRTVELVRIIDGVPITITLRPAEIAHAHAAFIKSWMDDYITGQMPSWSSDEVKAAADRAYGIFNKKEWYSEQEASDEAIGELVAKFKTE